MVPQRRREARLRQLYSLNRWTLAQSAPAVGAGLGNCLSWAAGTPNPGFDYNEFTIPPRGGNRYTGFAGSRMRQLNFQPLQEKQID